MSYLAFDLDALKMVPDAARAAGLPDAELGYGLLRLWSYCWTVKTDLVKPAHLVGFFGGDSGRVTAGLEAFGFLQADPDGLRVKGVEKYLRIRKAQSEAGKSKATNLNSSQDIATGSPQAQPELSSPTAQALTASSEQRAPNSEQRTPNIIPLPKKPENRFESGEAYFAWLQHERLEAGFVTEKPPQGLGGWFSEVMLELNGDGARLDATVRAFAKDDFWRKRNAPMRGLMSKWRDYVPRAVAS